MTSTTFSNKEFKALFKWAFRRNRTIMIIFSIILGLGFVLNAYIMAVDNWTDDSAPVTILVYEIAALFFTFVSALKTFSYLHNKRSVDMFGALPSTRPTLMVSHLAAGIVSVAAPFTVASILIMGMLTRTGEMFRLSLFLIFTALLAICASYTFTALIAHCCGTIIDTAIVTVAANGIWCGTIALYRGFASEMIPGIDFSSIVDVPILTALAPYSFSFIDVYYYEESNLSVILSTIAWQILFTVGVYFLTIFVSSKRKAETSQNGFAFSWLPMVIKAGASVVAGGFIGFVAGETADSGYGNLVVFAFWYIIIALTAFVILHIIFSRGFKGKIKPSLIVFASTSACAIAVVFALSYGLGIDTYVPDTSVIKSVEFDNVVYSKPENIELVTQIHQVIVDDVHNVEDYPYYFGSSRTSYYESEYDYSDSYTYNYNDNYETYELIDRCSFDITYNKKIGFDVNRSYYISGYTNRLDPYYYDQAKIESLLKALENSDEYKMAQNPLIWHEDQRKDLRVSRANIQLEVYNGSGSFTPAGVVELPKDDAFMNGLYEALQKDILNDSAFALTDGYNLIDKTAKFGDDIYYLDIGYVDKHSTSSYDYTYGDRPIYLWIKPDYKNTLDYLKAKDMDPRDKSNLNVNQSNGSDDPMTDYDSFGWNGDLETFKDYVNKVAMTWEYESCQNANVKDISQWHKENFGKYVTALNFKAEELYNKYYDSKDFKDPNYTNDFINEGNAWAEYYQLEDYLIEQLKEYSDTYVENSLKANTADTPSKTDSNRSNNNSKVTV